MTIVPEDLGYHARRVRRLGIPPGVRDARVVHQLDGILNDVEPAEVTQAGHALWKLWRRHPEYEQPSLLIGLDAGGILPTVAVSLASGLPYRLAWKLDLDIAHKHRFSEPSARRTDVFVYGDLADARVLVVDDEITTGQTLSSLVPLLRDAGAHVVGAACLVEDTAGNARPLLASLGIPLCALTCL